MHASIHTTYSRCVFYIHTRDARSAYAQCAVYDGALLDHGLCMMALCAIYDGVYEGSLLDTRTIYEGSLVGTRTIYEGSLSGLS